MPDITTIHQIDLGTLHLEPGRAYVLVYDRGSVAADQAAALAAFFRAEGLTCHLLGVRGPIDHALRCVVVDVPEPTTVMYQGTVAPSTTPRNPKAQG